MSSGWAASPRQELDHSVIPQHLFLCLLTMKARKHVQHTVCCLCSLISSICVPALYRKCSGGIAFSPVFVFA